MADFKVSEYEARLERTHKLMAHHNIDALFLTTEAEIRYFTGFRTLFWQSPTRSWYLIIPRDEKPIAVIPTIGEDLMRLAFIGSTRVFNSPAANNEEVPLLKKALAPYQRIAMPMGEESSLRMPLNVFFKLNIDFIDATPLIKSLRTIKSCAEIDYIEKICAIAGRSFAAVPDWLEEGLALDEIFRQFKKSLLTEGAEDVMYLVGGAGRDGYGDVISPPSNQKVKEGDILMLDTGATLAGYFCDFDRNFALGAPSKLAKDAQNRLVDATCEGIAAARPGVTCQEVYERIAKVLGTTSSIGRMGHGLGMQLTEWPSIAPHDTTVIKENMVLTIEPAISYGDGLMMVHEENIVIGETGNRVLTPLVDKW